jgi:uncharacterized membrane protein
MNKTRIESISDGVFAFVMTLLILNIHVPTVTNVSDTTLWHLLGAQWPSFVSYAMSFLVLAVFWINHQFLFLTYVKTVDRWLNLLNMIYLMFLVFVPFSVNLLGTFLHNHAAVIIYGANILALMLLTIAMFAYTRRNTEVGADVSRRLRLQAGTRMTLTLVCYLLGLLVSFVSLPAAIFLYVFPMVFNFIPGTLNIIERFVFGKRV